MRCPQVVRNLPVNFKDLPALVRAEVDVVDKNPASRTKHAMGLQDIVEPIPFLEVHKVDRRIDNVCYFIR